MFGNDKKVGNFDTTLVSSKAEVVGDIKLTGGLHIDGQITGNVIAEPGSGAVVRVSDKGVVKGEIRAPHIIINGRVTGDVVSFEHIELAKKAEVNGDVYYATMEMVMGARVNGKLLHKPEEKGAGKKKLSRFADSGNDSKSETARSEGAKSEGTKSENTGSAAPAGPAATAVHSPFSAQDDKIAAKANQ